MPTNKKPVDVANSSWLQAGLLLLFYPMYSSIWCCVVVVEGRAAARRRACKYTEMSASLGHNVDQLLAVAVGFHCDVISCHRAQRGMLRGASSASLCHDVDQLLVGVLQQIRLSRRRHASLHHASSPAWASSSPVVTRGRRDPGGMVDCRRTESATGGATMCDGSVLVQTRHRILAAATLAPMRVTGPSPSMLARLIRARHAVLTQTKNENLD